MNTKAARRLTRTPAGPAANLARPTHIAANNEGASLGNPVLCNAVAAHPQATEPDLPEEIPIAWVHYAANFAIIETTIELPPSLKAERIRGNLESLLASSRVYPPARALAVIPVEDSPLPWPQFAERLEQLLTHYFRMQSTSGFRLLRCLKDQGDSLEMAGHGGVGHFYWVLAATAEQITWVSDHDYMIYSASVNDFEIPPDVKLPTELPATPTQQS